MTDWLKMDKTEVPSQDKWQNAWNQEEVSEILKIAEELMNKRGVRDGYSAWRAAENVYYDFSSKNPLFRRGRPDGKPNWSGSEQA